MRAVVVVLRQRRADRHRVHLVEPAGRAVRRGPARPHRRGSGEARDRPRRRGHVVDDPRGVFCPLALGTTEVTVTTAGRRVSSTIEVVPMSALRLPREVRVTPIAPGTCGFPDFAARERPEDQPAVAPEAPAPAQPPIPAPIVPQPAPAPNPAPAPQPLPQTAPPVPPPPPVAPVEPAPLVSQPPVDHGAPARRAGGQAPGARRHRLRCRPASRSSPRPRRRCKRSRRPRCSSSAVARRRSRPTAPPWPTRTRLRRCRGRCRRRRGARAGDRGRNADRPCPPALACTGVRRSDGH